MPANAWLIPALALVSWIVTVLIGRRLGERAAYIGVIGLGIAFVLAVVNLFSVMGGARAEQSIPWLRVGDMLFSMGFRVGSLEAVMLFMVTFVSWMVLIFSRGYMHGDARFNRFFANVSLFITGMLTLVIADNLILFIVAWEVMGLCSYLLIGHWFEDLDNARAAMKAFMVTRLGDMGLLLGAWLLFSGTGSLKFSEIFAGIEAGGVESALITLAAFGLFAAVMGKSAQVPLHIWLPDAMAGPTPVSALIHAATMVAAGVFLVARAYPVFQAADPVVLATVAFIGAVTSLIAALIATVQTDIKKVLAYSTISQLGLMILSLGVGGFAAGIFHLIMHAFFKALLFLGAGSVIHAAGTQELHKMGGLFRKMPITGVTFIIGTLALAGIPPLSGFFSKDEILLEAFHSPFPVLFWLAVAASFLTAYYMMRAVILTFFGEPRDRHVYEHAHESPVQMTLPLVALAVPAVLAGFVGAPFLGQAFQHFLQPNGHFPEVSGTVLRVALSVGFGGILTAYLMYGLKIVNRAALIRILHPLYVLLKQKFYFDHVGGGVVGATILVRDVIWWFDRIIVDSLVNGTAALILAFGSLSRRLAVGSAQAYAMMMFSGVVIGLFFYTFARHVGG